MNQIATRPGNGFALEPSNMQEAMNMATMLANSSLIPPAYKGKPEDTLVAMMMGSEVGLNPIQALQNIAVINGRPSIYGDAMVALVQSHPSFGGIEESFDESTMTASCTVWRRSGTKHTQTFSQKDAVTAKLWGKAGPWTQYPKRMLQMRARGFAVRSQFADALAGLITREEAEDLPIEREVNPAASTATSSAPAQSRTSTLKDKLRPSDAAVIDQDPDPRPADAQPKPEPLPEPEELPLAATTYAEVMAAINAADSPESMQAAKEAMIAFCGEGDNDKFQEELGKRFRERLAELKGK